MSFHDHLKPLSLLHRCLLDCDTGRGRVVLLEAVSPRLEKERVGSWSFVANAGHII